MKIKVSASFGGVISTGEFQNSRPCFDAEVELEVQEKAPQEIEQWQEVLNGICLASFKRTEQRLITERIAKERADIRFYECPHCEERHPSVTSIIGWDADFFVSPQELQQYASQGNLYDLQAKNFIETGKFQPVEEIDGSWADLVIVRQGSLKLPVNDWDFPAFLKKYPVTEMKVGKPIHSCKHKFAGTPDVRSCVLNGKKTLADFKRTPDKLKHFKQVAAYIMAEEERGESPYEQMALIPCNGKTEQGFSKPITTEEIGQYKALFLKDREAFKKRFGV